jgi:hypothetical protein
MFPFVFAAGLMALYFIGAALQRPRPAEFLAAILWGAYAVYEYFVANGTLCDANCNIRVDLVLFFPLLGAATYLAFQKEPRHGAVLILCVVCLSLFALISGALGYTAGAAIATVGALIAVAYGLRSIMSRRQR